MSASSTPYSFKFKRIFKMLACRQSTWILSIALSLCYLNELSSQQTMTNQAPNSLVAGPFTQSMSELSDLIVVEGSPTNTTVVSLYKNGGNGQFTRNQIAQFVGSNFAHVAVGNLGDSDANIDFALQLDTVVLVYQNSLVNPGTFSLSPQGPLPTPKAPNSIATGQFQSVTQTGNDIVVACSGNNSPSLAVYFNNSMGDFTLPPTTVPLSSFPSSVATGDVDGDGIDEIVVTYFSTNQVEIFKQTSPNQFTSLGIYSVGRNPTAVAVGPLQGTNTQNQDIAVTNFTDNTVSVLLNNGPSSPGTFQQNAVNYAVQNAPLSLVITDLNNDGIQDIAVANQASSTVSLLINKGNGTFNPAVNQNANSGPVSITAGNFYSPGSIGLGVANSTGGYFTVFKPSTEP